MIIRDVILFSYDVSFEKCLEISRGLSAVVSKRWNERLTLLGACGIPGFNENIRDRSTFYCLIPESRNSAFKCKIFYLLVSKHLYHVEIDKSILLGVFHVCNSCLFIVDNNSRKRSINDNNKYESLNMMSLMTSLVHQ